MNNKGVADRIAAGITDGSIRFSDSLDEIAVKVGASRSGVYKLMPGWHKARRRAKEQSDDRTLTAFFLQNPNAALPLSAGGVTLAALRTSLGWSRERLLGALKRVNPPRSQRLYIRRLGDATPTVKMRVLGERECVQCGRMRPWRTIDRDNFRQGVIRFVACSRRCSQLAAHRGLPREKDTWPIQAAAE